MTREVTGLDAARVFRNRKGKGSCAAVAALTREASESFRDLADSYQTIWEKMPAGKERNRKVRRLVRAMEATEALAIALYAEHNKAVHGVSPEEAQAAADFDARADLDA